MCFFFGLRPNEKDSDKIFEVTFFAVLEYNPFVTSILLDLTSTDLCACLSIHGVVVCQSGRVVTARARLSCHP